MKGISKASAIISVVILALSAANVVLSIVNIAKNKKIKRITG